MGSRIRLEYPDGHERPLELGDGAELTLRTLPRGPYEVDVEGPRVSFTRPLSLSRDQDLQLQVITWLDFAVVLLLLVAIVVGLMLIGRPRLVRRIPVLGPRLSRRSAGSRL